jgi:CHAT domain-containing protein
LCGAGLDEMAVALRPLCHRIEAGQVRLVPVGTIAGLPVCAIIERETRIPVSVTGSAALHARAAAATRLPSSPIRTLAVTNPSPCSFGAPLPGATREGEWLAGRKTCSTIHLDGVQATRAHVVTALGSGVDLAHFGTHGHFDPENPHRGALYLANGPDGTAQTLSPDELTGPAAVILACCTLAGVGRRLPDEHQGFNSAMLSAGTWFVLSPLWPVADRAAARLVTTFYQYLFAGSDPAPALLAARARARERYGAQSPCWAGWVLAGG